jgi:ubiquinone/menaquinone biosynthesis C-methylase UbiE
MTTMQYYDEGAIAYDRSMGRWSRLDIPALPAAAELTIDHHVLDVATGTGEVALTAEARRASRARRRRGPVARYAAGCPP